MLLIGLAPMTLCSVDRQPFLTVASVQYGAYLKSIYKYLAFLCCDTCLLLSPP